MDNINPGIKEVIAESIKNNIEDYPIRAEVLKIGTIDDINHELVGWEFGRCRVGVEYSLEQGKAVKWAGYTLDELREIANAQ